MVRELRKVYFTLLVPAFFALVVSYALKQFHVVALAGKNVPEFVGPLIFIAAAACAVALPVLLRSVFAHRVRDKKSVPREELAGFERRLLYIALGTPYLLVPAFIFHIPRFYFGGTALLALYAVYFFYPSEKKVAFEKRLFRSE